ncbi:MAG: TIGR02147 family protein [Bdellovibrio sp.]|nr:TIGR02147 family protein [Bdellovibrio sp.]
MAENQTLARSNLSILEYDNYRIFLNDLISERGRKNASLSLRSFANFTHVSVSVLSRVLNGERMLTANVAVKIAMSLKFTAKETQHLLNLIDLERATSDDDRAKIFKRMQGPHKSKILSLETFRLIAEWQHFAIMALTHVKGFRSDAFWIADRLKISPTQTKSSVERLMGLNLLRQEGKKLVVQDTSLQTTIDIPDGAIQESHRQQLQKAQEALSEIEVSLRDFTSLTLNMNLTDLKVAKNKIREFVDDFEKTLEKKPSDQVFQLNVQLYPLTKIEKGRA